MLKGINKQVVEINRPDSSYFEKVIFFVRPEYASLSEEKLRSKADMYISDSEKPPRMKQRKKRFSALITFMKFFSASVAGAVAGAAVIFFSMT